MASTAHPQVLPHARAGVCLARAGAVLVASLLLLGWAPGQAVAHDALVSTAPGDGTTVEEPDAVVLTFSADQLAVGAVVAVTGPDGQEWGDGAATVSGVTVAQPLREGLPSGEYQVNWRSVSGDGHPVDGTFRFTAEAPESLSAPEPSPSGPATSPPPEPSAASEQAGPGAGEPQPDQGEPEDRSGRGIGAPTAVGLAIAAAAIVAVGGAVFLRRRSGGERRTEP
ncbi:copper resistance protein CopC [Cellulomonas sp. APG4]|uniref:Copper resistance protein CopC n=1 Tax=Cellulomonas carbonis T26 TaxID=947969 RepID=A0A0A0C040_9CELL|nr:MULTISPECIES: copper resistance CopC family protein [Cellulomonas]KGM12749.1 copper resistance protein CopC [Cellulomonas carbonis T26]MDT0166650.1 copper resistance protein CopC [Actinotalea sp. AC32]NCT89488.1 copper resistance protein CopC [Cellulomonas sp. APG4]GGC14103.1 hypothetical protein GCM10010972_29320 [Cellulomonas carbonis]